ncbi:MAG: glycogen/starch synthase [Bacteroidales bacterium]|nr:glycogen/starch synthase [Bacteroidales bacterium]
MKKKRVLYISQAITPFLPETEMSRISRLLPQGIQEREREIRTFMPKFGVINERRHQLHEVIRLSGMNLIIDDTDHPLIIKVASIQAARMQVYFIDNEDYFMRKSIFSDENGQEFEDNDERVIFFARGVLETVKKLRWTPDLVHCHGWFSSLIPFYLRTVFKDDPLLGTAKIVYSVYDDPYQTPLRKEIKEKMMMPGMKPGDLSVLDGTDYFHMNKMAIDHSDAVILGSDKVSVELAEYAKSTGKPMLTGQDTENFVEVYSQFYKDQLGV